MLDYLKLLCIVLLPCAASSCTSGKTLETKADGSMKTAGMWELIPEWPQLPAGVILGAVSGVAVDSRGNVVAVHRAEREFSEHWRSTEILRSISLMAMGAGS